MEILPVVSRFTGFVTLGVVAAGFILWGAALWWRDRRK